MKKLLIISFLLFSFSSFAQKNFTGIDFFPIGKSLNDLNIELIYQRQINNKHIVNLKIYNTDIGRNQPMKVLELDTCLRNSYYADAKSIGLRLGYGHNILEKNSLSIYVGSEVNLTHNKGLIYVIDYGFCEVFYKNHDYFLLGSPAKTRGTSLGIVPTVNLQYQFWKNFVFTLNLGIELNYEINQRGYVNLEGELIKSGYTGFLSDFNRNYLIQDIGLLYRF